MKKDDNSTFSDFQLIEYQNIASAHFEVQKQLSIFFRYYILFISVPFLILTVIKSDSKSLIDMVLENESIFSIVFFFLALCGFFFGQYMAALKNEQALYARAVNNIRKYFYTVYGKDNWYPKYGLLPIGEDKPKYSQSFQPLILIVKILNSAFFGLAVFLLLDEIVSCKWLIMIIVSVVIFSIHQFIYEWRARNFQTKWHDRDRSKEFNEALDK